MGNRECPKAAGERGQRQANERRRQTRKAPEKSANGSHGTPQERRACGNADGPEPRPVPRLPSPRPADPSRAPVSRSGCCAHAPRETPPPGRPVRIEAPACDPRRAAICRCMLGGGGSPECEKQARPGRDRAARAAGQGSGSPITRDRCSQSQKKTRRNRSRPSRFAPRTRAGRPVRPAARAQARRARQTLVGGWPAIEGEEGEKRPGSRRTRQNGKGMQGGRLKRARNRGDSVRGWETPPKTVCVFASTHDKCSSAGALGFRENADWRRRIRFLCSPERSPRKQSRSVSPFPF